MIASSIMADEAIVTIRILLVTIRSSFRIMPTTPGRTSPPAATCSQERHNRPVGIRAELTVVHVKVIGTDPPLFLDEVVADHPGLRRAVTRPGHPLELLGDHDGDHAKTSLTGRPVQV